MASQKKGGFQLSGSMCNALGEFVCGYLPFVQAWGWWGEAWPILIPSTISSRAEKLNPAFHQITASVLIASC